MSTQSDRINALLDTVKTYVKNEQTRIDNETASLQAILDKRSGGKAIEKVTVKVVKETADNDLKSFLEGAP